MALGKQIIRSTRLPQVPGGSSQSFRSTAAVYFHVNNMVDNIVRKINVCKIEVHYARNVGLAFQEYFGLVCKAKIVSREFVSRALNY